MRGRRARLDDFDEVDRLEAEELEEPVFQPREVVEQPDVPDELFVVHVPAAGDQERAAAVAEHDNGATRAGRVGLKGWVLRVWQLELLLLCEALAPGFEVVLVEAVGVAVGEVEDPEQHPSSGWAPVCEEEQEESLGSG